MSRHLSRRSFLGIVLLGGAAPLAGGHARAFGNLHARHPLFGEHPEPREGIDASLVMTDEMVEHLGEDVVEVYRMIRAIPQVADGIGCYCGCVARPNYRSLLTCYYEDGMARGCPICQGEARLVYRRHTEGQTLAQIRRAVDARYE
ncbi:MAG: hypothetical protein HKN17_00675 [Rhodothermales bacterium]|nr:hypothetical protein [Rhodothermales bacterium]